MAYQIARLPMTLSEKGPPKGHWHGAYQELNPAQALA